MRREVPPPPSTEPVKPLTAGVGPGLDRDIPPPWERNESRCTCGFDAIAASHAEYLRVAGVTHAVHCPMYVALETKTGCTACDTGSEPHFHEGHILYEAGRRLY
jgi:hypothetical protein